MSDEFEIAPDTGIDRRSLLKKAGAAGALGLTAPIAFDSFFSPAAACSVDPVNASLLVGSIQNPANAGPVWSDDGAGTQTYTSPSFTAAAGTPFVVAFNLIYLSSVAVPTVTVTGTGTGTISPVLGTGTPLQQYDSTTSSRSYLGVYEGTTNAGGGHVITITLGAALGWNFIGQVVTVPGSTVLSATGNSGTGTAATGTLSSPGATSGELLVVGSSYLSATNGNTHTVPIWTAPTNFTEVTDEAENMNGKETTVPRPDLSLQTSFDDTAVASATANSSVTGSWGAVAVEFSC